MSNQNATIIIKKIKKVSAGAHGGSWKVAYADFVTAMMAFFLLMWLLNIVPKEKQAAIANYYKTFSIFQEGGAAAGKPSIMEPMAPPASPAASSSVEEMPVEDHVQKPEEFKEIIRNAIEAKLGDIKDQIMVDVIEGGVRIQLVDKEGKPMFAVGSSSPTPMATRIMQVIGDQIRELPNSVAVEGHSDALAFKSEASRGNWELSTERALAAKKQLEGFGLDNKRLTRVAGYADTLPFIQDNPQDPRNRRINIILLFPERKAAPAAPQGPEGAATPAAGGGGANPATAVAAPAAVPPAAAGVPPAAAPQQQPTRVSAPQPQAQRPVH